MNDWLLRPHCVCRHRPERPDRPFPESKENWPPSRSCDEKAREGRLQYGNCFLMQQILAGGRLHRQRQCYPLCLCDLPPEAQQPVTVLDVSVCNVSSWKICKDQRMDRIQVTVPLSVRLRDGCGCVYAASSRLTETLWLKARERLENCWRGQIHVQAAVRLAGRPCPCENAPCQVPLEVLIEGFLLSPCAVGCPENPPCPPSRPWYPQPIFDPYND